MSNEENNLGMAGETGVNESPANGMGGMGGAAGVSSMNEGGAADQSSEGGPGDPDLMADFSPNRIAELETKAAKADENWEKYVRAVADLDNYKKRALRERQDATKYANEALLEKLLPVVDNFEAALAAANAAQGSQSGNVDSLKMGINMIHTQLKSFLADAGVEEIDALNKPFDPNLHEAVSQQPSANVPEGQVLQQMRKGYRYRDRLIRPAMVVVAKKP